MYNPHPPTKTNTAVWIKVEAVKMLTWGKRQQHNSVEEPEQRRRAAFCVGLKTNAGTKPEENLTSCRVRDSSMNDLTHIL